MVSVCLVTNAAARHPQETAKAESETNEKFGSTTPTFAWGHEAFAKGGVFPNRNERAEWRFLKQRDLCKTLYRLLIAADSFIKHSILHRWRGWWGWWGLGGGAETQHARSSHANSAGGNKRVGGNLIFTAQSFIRGLLHQWPCGARL